MDEQNGHSPQLTELRGKLADGLAQSRLSQTQLAQRAGLGRTTVSQALSPQKPMPSAETVAALSRALQLPEAEMLALRRTAVQQAGPGTIEGPGRPIGEWAPYDLEVHRAGPGLTAAGSELSEERAWPAYVRREHDRVLGKAVDDAIAGRSRILVLVGASSTGKTRACWEAVQPLADQGWRLWHPFDPTRTQAALEQLHRVGPRTVVWLNEAQHYLGDRAVGEQIAAAVHLLLVSRERGPVLVLGTLWPEYATRYTALPMAVEPDLHSRVRELLAGKLLAVPDAFDAPALAAARALAEDGDWLLADALTRAHADGRITQDLAGAPELLNRYQHAGPAAKAVLQAAMDARRLGVGLHLPQAFLTDASTDYLSQLDYDQLTDGWTEQAYAELAKPVHGKQAPLRQTSPRPMRRPPAPASVATTGAGAGRGPQFRLADYLEQHGRTSRRRLCPPASFWHAALTHLAHPDDLNRVADEAEKRLRLQWAHHLRYKAAAHGSPMALALLAVLRAEAGDSDGAEVLARQAAGLGDTNALHQLAMMREEAEDWDGAEALLYQAVDLGDTHALRRLAMIREQAGDRDGAEALLYQAVDLGDTDALRRLAIIREQAGDRDGAEALLYRAVDLGDTDALRQLAEMREEAEDRDGAEALIQQAADLGDTDALRHLAVTRERAGDRDGAEALLRQAAGLGATDALHQLAEMWEEAGDRDGAEALIQQAADLGDTDALHQLAVTRERAGDRDGAEALARKAVVYGDAIALCRLAVMRESAGDQASAETLARHAAAYSDTDALRQLAMMREEAGDRDGAEALSLQAADRGDTIALCQLAVTREKAGDWASAETLARQAADHGDTGALRQLAVMRESAGDLANATILARAVADYGGASVDYEHTAWASMLRMRWPHGMDPDGTPTAPWQPTTDIPRSSLATFDASAP
ncbi:helix-turn-helix domain-containing protein [Streptomyces longwoodensis]|uniref:helix-turn-helix domain-containing protein n=1 Tax=Streptomyces longwoodensis TaxID=68231 RepID=UPI00384D566A